MRRAFALALTGLFLVSIFIGTASAITYTVVNLRSESATAPSPGLLSTAQSGHKVWVFDRTAGGAIEVFKSVNDGVTWDAGTTVESTSASIIGDFKAVDSNTLIGCFRNSAQTSVIFKASTNGGTLWNNAITIATTAGAFQTCSIDWLSPTTYVATYADSTSSKLQSKKSTDSGATWGTAVDVKTSFTIDAATRRTVSMAAQHGSTNAVVIAHQGSGATTTNACYTTDSAATWTCSTIVGDSPDLQITYVSASRFDVVTHSTTGDVINYCRTTSGGATWGCTSVVSGETQTTSIAIAVLDSNQTKAVVTWTRANTVNGIRSSVSTNLLTDLTWSTPDTVETLGGTSTSPNGGAAATTSAGNIIVAYQYCNTAGTCSGTQFLTTQSAYSSSFSSAVAPAASVTVTNLVGMSVDPAGGGMIVRVNNGAKLDSYNPISLTVIDGGQVDTHCTATNPRIMTSGLHHAYVFCDTGTGLPASLEIRNLDLSAATFTNSDCGTVNPEFRCPSSIPLSAPGSCGGGYTETNNFAEINELDASGLEWNDVVGSPTLHALSWSWSANSGKIGFAEYTKFTSVCSGYREQIDTFTGGSTVPTQICSWHDSSETNDRVRLGAVAPSVVTKIWPFQFTTDEGRVGNGFGHTVRTGILSAPASFSALNEGNGIACSGTKFIVDYSAGTQVAVFDRITGLAVWGPRTITGATRGVAMSQDGLTAAYVDGPAIKIVYVSNGTEKGSVALPAGSMKQMQLSVHANSLWVATSTTLARFDLSAAGITPIQCESGDCSGAPPTSTSGPGNGFPNIGIGTTGGNAILGFLLMVIAAILGFAVFGGAKKLKTKEPLGNGPGIGAGIFSVSMFFIDGVIGLFPLVIVLGTMLVGGAIWYFLKRGGG